MRWVLKIVNEAIDLVAITQNKLQAIIALTPVVITHVMRGVAATRDCVAELFCRVTKTKRFLDDGFAFAINDSGLAKRPWSSDISAA